MTQRKPAWDGQTDISRRGLVRDSRLTKWPWWRGLCWPTLYEYRFSIRNWNRQRDKKLGKGGINRYINATVQHSQQIYTQYGHTMRMKQYKRMEYVCECCIGIPDEGFGDCTPLPPPPPQKKCIYIYTGCPQKSGMLDFVTLIFKYIAYFDFIR